MRRLPASAFVAFAALLGIGATTPASAQCAGDCNGDGHVTITEVVTVINMALGVTATCENADKNGDGVDVSDVVSAVNFAGNEGGSCVITQTECGDGVVTAPEECDVGGTCTGGSHSGMACTSEADCGAGEPGVCDSGTGALRQCNSDTDCGGGTCKRCRTFGGAAIAGDTAHTCAANCTFESRVALTLAQGMFAPGGAVLLSGSGATVHSGVLGDVPLALTGSLALTVGKPGSDGVTPLTLKSDDLVLPPIPVATLACACVRGVPAKTCGGFAIDLDGNLATDCSEGFPNGASICGTMSLPPCAFVHGPGNSGSGLIGCNGLTPINLQVSQDSRGSQDPPACLTAGVGAPTCADPPVITVSGTNPAPGSALLVTHTAIGVKTGSCTNFCTASDPIDQRGSVNPLLLTTGTATGIVLNVDGQDGVNNENPATQMPWAVTGAPKSCTDLQAGNASGEKFAGTFTAINQSMLGDIVVEAVFESQ